MLDHFAIGIMKGVQEYFLFVIVLCRRVTAIPYLVAREGGESLFDPFLDELGSATLGAAEAIWRMVSPEDRSPQSNPEQVPAKATPDDSSASNPDIESLESMASSPLPRVKNECDQTPPTSDQDSNGIVPVSIMPTEESYPEDLEITDTKVFVCR